MVLAALYAWRGLHYAALPGADPLHPEGWWGWFDQSRYLESARAFAALDVSPERHWYPFGYALLGAAFVRVSPVHPFAVVDLVCLLACYAGFLGFARRVGVGSGWAGAVFLASVAWNPLVFIQWVVPWNTTPVAALLWLLLACVARNMVDGRGSAWIGALAAGIPLLRPTEALVAGLCVLATLPGQRRLGRHLALMVLGGAGPVLGYAALHWRIYGWAPSPYMLHSRTLGFSLHGLDWKAYTILLDPRPWFLDGVGLLRPLPFVALAVPGLAVAFAHGRAAALLAVLVAAHTALYLAYVDLLPVGLWRYGNVHYWMWALPGMGLLGFLLVRDLVRWRRAPGFPLAPAAVAVAVPLLCLRAEPVPAAAGESARMLAFPGPPPGFTESFFMQSGLRDARGPMRIIAEYRAIPVPDGMRVFGIARDFDGPVRWDPPPQGWQGDGEPVRYRAEWRLGVPCWMPRVRCSRVANDLLPPVAGP